MDPVGTSVHPCEPDPSAITLDERGRRCPLPVLALARACQQQPPGTVIEVLSDDPAAEFDIPAWCRLKGAQFLGQVPQPDGEPGMRFRVRSAGPA